MMDRTSLFIAFLLTALLCINGVRAIYNRSFAMGATFIAIPICGWASIIFGSTP